LRATSDGSECTYVYFFVKQFNFASSSEAVCFQVVQSDVRPFVVRCLLTPINVTVFFVRCVQICLLTYFRVTRYLL